MVLKRFEADEQGIFSELTTDVGNKYITLEHAFASGSNYAPKLPAGVYKCVRGEHQLEHGGPFSTFEITGVPGHTGILFHVGNYNSDSNGCLILGVQKLQNMVACSKLAFDRFMAELSGINEFSLTVEG